MTEEQSATCFYGDYIYKSDTHTDEFTRILKINPKIAQRVLRRLRLICAKLVPQEMEGFI